MVNSWTEMARKKRATRGPHPLGTKETWKMCQWRSLSLVGKWIDNESVLEQLVRARDGGEGRKKRGIREWKGEGSKGARKRREGTILQEKSHKYHETTWFLATRMMEATFIPCNSDTDTTLYIPGPFTNMCFLQPINLHRKTFLPNNITDLWSQCLMSSWHFLSPLFL